MDSLERDTESRNRIVSDINTNFFVEAGAGSGKTTMLVNRMVAMVESGIDISRISAITFTKAAAGEFYERFQKILIERSNPEYIWKDKGYAGQLPRPTEETRKRCVDALQNIDLCFMGTIDSFCNMILSEHPSEAGILSDSALVTDVDRDVIYRQIYVKICNGEYGNELKTLANSFRTVHRYDQDVFCRGMSLFMDHRNVHFNYDVTEINNIDKDFAGIRNELIETTGFLYEHPEVAYLDNKQSAAAWENIEDIYRSINRKWSYNYSSVLWALKQLKDIRVIPAAMDAHGPYLSDFFEPGGAKGKWLECTVGRDNNILLLLQKLQYNMSVAFVNRCIPVIEKEMHDAGHLTYFDYLYYLRNMLRKDADNDGKLIRYIYERHSYFLIDEFQDTNPMQAEVFFYLSSEKPVSRWDECIPRDGSLFIVGDPKQSIYRFRNADVTSFLKVKRLFSDGVGEILELTRNFRSTSCVCEFFNSKFSQMLPEETVNQSKFERIPLPDPVEDEFQGVYNYSIENSDDDPGMIAEIVNRLVGNDKFKVRGKDDNALRPIRYSDIMVITYAKKNIADIMYFFDNFKIPTRVEGQVLFEVNDALKELYRLYSAIVDVEDRISLYGALTSRTMAITKEELLIYRSCDGRISLKSDFDIDDCTNETAKKVATKIKEFKEIRARSRNMSSAALLSYILDHLKIYSIADTKNLEVVYYALELIRNAERSGIVVSLLDGKNYLADLLSGDTDIERCLSLNDNENCVHLANLHKVKGLEAPVVILACAKIGPTNPSIRIQYNDDSVEGYLFELEKEDKSNGSYFKTDAFQEEKELEIEALNAETIRKIYVAATRARNALIICDYGSRNRWKDLSPESYPSIEGVIKDCHLNIVSNTGSVEAEELYSKAAEDCVFNNRTSEEKTYTVETPSRLRVVSKVSDDISDLIPITIDPELRQFAPVIGTMTHKLMEKMVSSRNSINQEDSVKEIISEYRTARMQPYEDKITEALTKVADTMVAGGYKQSNGLPSDILNTLLSADEVYCEVPYSYKENTPDGVVIWNGVMDALYCEQGQWHIVDYKTNADGNDLDTKYQRQLDSYAKAFKAITGNDADAFAYHIDV